MAARSDRQRNDQDPADWVPSSPEARCGYVGGWVAARLRWKLAANGRELEGLKVHAEGSYEDAIVRCTPAP
ncbi:hypothetical protein A3L22_26720 [Streptomyces griseus subsp. griseus]|nr:hypothetical protein A3L22_26720 [Streptomyces griseus subsp. griseus]